ncbi:MAG: hypothetical protein K9L68_08490 [Spirochaetales bacterium]|nr:hypothetical protein [Spirochaetales bacterium]MCF7938622.1 hypothetical protein [Spirochaetales bacterium]
MKRFLFSVIIALLLLFSSAAAVSSLTVDALEAEYGLLWLGKYEGGDYQSSSTPSPILNTLGLTVPLDFENGFLLQPGLKVFGTDYLYTGSRAVPAGIEDKDAFYVLAMLLKTPIVFDFPLNENLVLSGEAGPSFLLRVPLVAYDAGESMRSDMTSYLFGSLRFLYPELGFSMRWKLNRSIALGFRTEFYPPVFHFWDGEDVPFYDQMMVDALMTLRFNLGGEGGEGNGEGETRD